MITLISNLRFLIVLAGSACFLAGIAPVQAQRIRIPRPIRNTPLDPTTGPREILKIVMPRPNPTITEIRPVIQRRGWDYNGGYFRSSGNGNWYEKGHNGDTLYFREQRRTRLYVQLYDASRSVGIRLFTEHCEYWESGSNGWRLLYYGGWSR